MRAKQVFDIHPMGTNHGTHANSFCNEHKNWHGSKTIVCTHAFKFSGQWANGTPIKVIKSYGLTPTTYSLNGILSAFGNR